MIHHSLRDLAALTSQANWIASDQKLNLNVTHEYELFTDLHVIDEITNGLGPYKFLNTVSSPTSPGIVDARMILRAEIRYRFDLAEIGSVSEIVTDDGSYHGGDSGEEIAAVASLALGGRIFCRSKPVREFLPGEDPLGRPMGRYGANASPPLLRIEPYSQYSPPHFVVPNATGQRDLKSLGVLKSIPKLTSHQYVGLVRACTLYNNSLWVAENDPNLAWLMLVSAIESAALSANQAHGTPSERLHRAKPEVFNLLKESGNTSLIEPIANLIVDSLGATNKFVKFILKYLPDPPEQRPDSHSQIGWSRSNLKKIFSKVYGYRSRALHGGTPFPHPMCGVPEGQGSYADTISGKAVASNEMPYGIAFYRGTSTWLPEDVPIYLNTFHYIARGALLNWWAEMAISAEEC